MSKSIEKSLNELLFSGPCSKHGLCSDYDCEHAVKQLPETGNWFITFGHCGFNAKGNNGVGYSTKARAMSVMRKYLDK